MIFVAKFNLSSAKKELIVQLANHQHIFTVSCGIIQKLFNQVSIINIITTKMFVGDVAKQIAEGKILRLPHPSAGVFVSLNILTHVLGSCMLNQACPIGSPWATHSLGQLVM